MNSQTPRTPSTGVGIMVEDGSRADAWLGVDPLFSVFPRLFRVVVNKLTSTKECHVTIIGVHKMCPTLLRRTMHLFNAHKVQLQVDQCQN